MKLTEYIKMKKGGSIDSPFFITANEEDREKLLRLIAKLSEDNYFNRANVNNIMQQKYFRIPSKFRRELP
jgi:hypothetical protein